MRPNTLWKWSLGVVLLASAVTWAQEEVPASSALARMPVRELTVFKDGHAFVMHQGKMPTNEAGEVLMDYLPAPVLGTFWPYAAEKGVKLASVTAGQRRVTVARSPLTIIELIEANPGAEVIITESPAGREAAAHSYPATIQGVTERSAEEMERTAPPNSGELLPKKGDVVLLKTTEGVKAVALARILDVTFKQPPKKALAAVEFRNLLTMKLDWADRKPTATADMGLVYLQRGIRWIPNYKLTVDGEGKATVQLQATLLNELTDLNDVTCHLVVGVPSFHFKETVDPMSLQQSLVQLSSYFQEANATHGQMLSNRIMTQSSRMSESRQRRPAPNLGGDLGLVGAGAENVEDLHIFTIQNITLKKGQRMVVPVAELTVPYEDVYVLDIPFAPPADVRRRFNTNQQSQIARMLTSPKVMHKLRLTNKSVYPFTTAPALILSGDRVLGQGLMTYTPKGGSVDLPITAAVDVQVKKADSEVKRTPNAVRWYNDSYERVDLTGAVTLTNYREHPAKLEVVRNVLGNITEASNDGVVTKLNMLEDHTYTSGRPHWWGWYNWPNWWGHFNGIGRIKWETTIEPGKSIELTYKWHYFWR
jgi:hypothetical protein